MSAPVSGPGSGAPAEGVRVYVNERPVVVPAGADVRAAVRAFDPALAGRLDDGTAYLTDGRGVALDPAAPLGAGAIVRVVVSARRGAGPAESGEAGDGED